MVNQTVVYLYINYYSVIINELLVDTITWVNLKIIMVSEKKPEKKNNTMLFHLYKILQGAN